MSEFANVIIGIQARSTSKRLPRKVFELVGEKTILDHVTASCTRVVQYLDKKRQFFKIAASWVLLVPEGDDICSAYGRRSGVTVLEGSEDDVLSRYMAAARQFGADYMVRITADCPLIPPYLIQKHISYAVLNHYDYISNVDERVRTWPDGFDCEVFSAALLAWANDHAVTPYDREHVSTIMRREPPDWASTGHVIGYMDLSGLKLSVDTPEDLDRVRKQYEGIQAKCRISDSLGRSGKVHRL